MTSNLNLHVLQRANFVLYDFYNTRKPCGTNLELSCRRTTSTMATNIRTSELKKPVDVATYLFTRLKQLGIDSIHGVPGDFNLVALDYIPKCGLNWVGNCNELNAGEQNKQVGMNITETRCRLCRRRLCSNQRNISSCHHVRRWRTVFAECYCWSVSGQSNNLRGYC